MPVISPLRTGGKKMRVTLPQFYSEFEASLGYLRYISERIELVRNRVGVIRQACMQLEHSGGSRPAWATYLDAVSI